MIVPIAIANIINEYDSICECNNVALTAISIAIPDIMFPFRAVCCFPNIFMPKMNKIAETIYAILRGFCMVCRKVRRVAIASVLNDI